MSAPTAVLFDVPGPRARARNTAAGIVTLVVVAALVAVVIWRLVTQVPRNALVHNGGWRTYWKTSGCPPRVSSQPGG